MKKYIEKKETIRGLIFRRRKWLELGYAPYEKGEFMKFTEKQKAEIKDLQDLATGMTVWELDAMRELTDLDAGSFAFPKIKILEFVKRKIKDAVEDVYWDGGDCHYPEYNTKEIFDDRGIK